MEFTKRPARATVITRATLAALATSGLFAVSACGSSNTSGAEGGSTAGSGTISSLAGGAGAAGGSHTGACSTCDQGLALALAGESDIPKLLCPGAAATAWLALEGCMHAACDSTCTPGPFADCLVCLEKPDSLGGCATQLGTCGAH